MCRQSDSEKGDYRLEERGIQMQKCMNDRDTFADESLHGIIKAYPSFYRFAGEDTRGVVYDGNTSRKVKIVTGGGYGHLPLFLGYVGKALCDGVAVGNVFTSPSSDTILNVAREMHTDQILFLFGNYFGDTMNFEMAEEMLEIEGICARILKGADDIASAVNQADRRGIAGILFAYKIAGAAADCGMDLNQVVAVVQKALTRISSLGAAFSSCRLPGAGHPIFELDETEMEIGMGIHGEPGISRAKMMSSRELAECLTEKCLADRNIGKGDRIAVLVNGLGSTSREELFILYSDMEKIFSGRGIQIARAYVGEYVTSMEMAGVSLSIMHLDEELEELLGTAAYSPFVTL